MENDELLKKDRKSMNFDERCELLRQTRLTEDMTYEERFENVKTKIRSMKRTHTHTHTHTSSPLNK